MYAISTVGSLVGTFRASLLLIPLVGTQRTFLVFALALALVAALGLGRRWRARARSPSPRCCASRSARSRRPRRARVIYEAETTYQYARVIEYPDGARQLELNEGQAIHSLWRRDTVLTGNYWDGLLTLPFTRPRRRRRARWRCSATAGGTVARAYAKYFPDTASTPSRSTASCSTSGGATSACGPARSCALHADDARPFLRKTDERYDFIFLDTYRQPYIPFYLATKEFFELARDRLAPGRRGDHQRRPSRGHSQLERVLTATMGAAFPHVARDPVSDTNTLLVGSTTRPSAERAARRGARRCRRSSPGGARGCAPARPPLPGGEVYTDDRAPVEWLVDKSLLDYAEGTGR